MNRLRYALANWLLDQWSLSTLNRRPRWLGGLALRLAVWVGAQVLVFQPDDINEEREVSP